jgi:hypothetical protein
MDEVTLKLSEGQVVLAAFLVGVFYRFMVKESVSEISVGRQEVADLLDKLTEAVHVNERRGS